ncbi:uncharacterized protein LOC142463559 isoform X1 [Ascaphus truei]|uniref:uncharacterized protein LOC142463559 isoform X1 n=1 Tax=Ascaphus truei TaxID=8439 RepID=UPI003F59ABF1
MHRRTYISGSNCFSFGQVQGGTPTQAKSLLRGKISQYSPGSILPVPGHGFQRVSLQLFGFYGHGKSSLVNLCLSIVRDEPYKNLTGVGWSEGSVLRDRREYSLTNYLYITDNRGFVNLDQEEIAEASAQLRSLRFVEDGVKWNQSLEEKLELLLKKHNTPPTDFIVPVIVYRGADHMTTQRSVNMKKFITRAYDITGSLRFVEDGVKWNQSLEEKLELLLKKHNTPPTDFIVPVIVYRGADTMTTQRSVNMKKFILRAYDITGIFPVVLLMESGKSLEKTCNYFGSLGVCHMVSLHNFRTAKPERNEETDTEILSFLNLCSNEADRGIKKYQKLGDMNVEHRRQVREQIRLEVEVEREKVKEQTREEMKREQEKVKEERKEEMKREQEDVGKQMREEVEE